MSCFMNNEGVTTDPVILMQRAKAGDQDAFGQLYQLYFVNIFRYIHVRIKDTKIVEDLTQAVFLKVYQHISNFEHRDVSPLAYFFIVARNAVIDHWRKKKDLSLDADEAQFATLPDTSENPRAAMERHEAVQSLHRAIDHLTPDQQDVITLKFIGELSIAEIAHIVQKNETAVRQLQCRALKSLRRYPTKVP